MKWCKTLRCEKWRARVGIAVCMAVLVSIEVMTDIGWLVWFCLIMVSSTATLLLMVLYAIEEDEEMEKQRQIALDAAIRHMMERRDDD